MIKYTLRPPALKPISGTRHAADADCPDASWKRLTNEQKKRLAILARQGYAKLQITGVTFDDWRHEVAIQACGLRISEATQAHWADLKSAFQIHAGQPDKAFQTQMREGDNKRRVAMFKLTQACQERGLHMSYPDSICHTQFKLPISEASAKQIWCLFYTVTNRRRPSA
jgi:integrase